MVHPLEKIVDEDVEEGLEFLRDLMTKNILGESALVKMQSFLRQAFGICKVSPRIIQVLGTNGKGSVVNQLVSILNCAGFSVGSTISPHLVEMNERCCINAVPIALNELGRFALRVKEICRSINLELPFPVAILAAATLCFIERGLDFIVLEAGLGGRNDASTAFENPEVISLTSIGRDHEHILGKYPYEIIREKLAALRNNTSLVLGRYNFELRDFIENETRKKAHKIIGLGQEFDYDKFNSLKYLPTEILEFNLASKQRINANLGLEGKHQADNLAVALQIASELGVDLSKLNLCSRTLNWGGRLERLYVNSLEWILDCAHNEEGVEVVANHLNSLADGKYTVIFSGLGEKKLLSMIKLLQPVIDELFLYQMENHRAADMQVLANELSSFEISSKIHIGSYRELIEKIYQRDNKNPVLVIGSVYLIGITKVELSKI
ncbi:MAG: hypothetical protein KDD56_02105 [Bdellovibrionales bacterium]|nr:hypothetical protein [Bdellovibrionales bacterium]